MSGSDFAALYEAMSTQRAVRRLRSDPIDAAALQRVMQAAAWSPSGGNQQPWRFVMVHDGATKERLGALYAARWERFAGIYRKRFADAEPSEQARHERTIAAGDHLAANFGNVPVVAVVCFNPDQMAITDARQARVSVVGGASIYPAVQNFLLACRAEGIGTVLTTLLCQDEAEVKALLKIPNDWYTAAALPLGYPVAGGYGPVSRRPVEELFFRDRWPD